MKNIVKFSLDGLVFYDRLYFYHFREPLFYEAFELYCNTIGITPNCDLVITIASEEYNVDELHECLDTLLVCIKKIAPCKIILIVNSCFETRLINFNPEFKIIYIDYFALKTEFVMESTNHPYNKSWNKTAEKALFLIGKPHRENRIGLLYQFYNIDALDSLEWSLYMSKTLAKTSKKYVPTSVDNLEYDKFINRVIKKLDNIDVSIQDFLGSSHYSGFPFDPSLYQNTKLSVISETSCYSGTMDHFITEKTYRAIYNNHPFVIAGGSGLLSTLKSNGFKTFENYMKEPNYSTITDIHQRMNAVATNTNYFLADCDNLDSIEKDVNYNFFRFKQYCSEIKERLGQYAPYISYYIN